MHESKGIIIFCTPDFNVPCTANQMMDVHQFRDDADRLVQSSSEMRVYPAVRGRAVEGKHMSRASAAEMSVGLRCLHLDPCDTLEGLV